MKIGIIGAENSHSGAISRTINVKKSVKGFSVDYLWGETDAFAKQTAEKGQIPNVVKDSRQMLGKIDALIVDHRHAKYHLKAAEPFLETGIPMFIDKPFCFHSKVGKAFLQKARRKKVPVTSFSTVPMQSGFQTLKKNVAKLGDIVGGASFGHADLKSKYGGVFFYGIHQVEMIVESCGYNVSSVLVTKHKECSTGQLFYSSGATVTMHFFKKARVGFNMAVMGTEGIYHQVVGHDEDPYLAGVKKFTKMFRTGKEPRPHAEILKPVLILEALERSLKSGKIEKVGR